MRPDRTPRGTLEWLLVVLAAAVFACNPSDPIDSQATPRRIQLEELGRIGELDGPAALTDVLSAVVGPDGNLYVTQWQDAYVSVYGVDGELRGTIARAGLGPGEFTMAGAAGFAGDTLWVAGSPSKIGLFRLDGTPIHDLRVRDSYGEDGSYYQPWAYTRDLGTLGEVVVRPEVAADPQGRRLPILALGSDGEITDTVAWFDAPRTTITPPILGSKAIVRVSELGATPFAFSPDGTAAVVVDLVEEPTRRVLRATWLDSRGDTTVVRERPNPPHRFPVERVVSELAELLGGSGLPVTAAAARTILEEEVPWPQYAAPFTSLVLGGDHRLWLRLEEDWDSARWEIWAPDATSVEDVWLPADVEIHYADSAQVWAERKNDLDVPFLSRYRIVR